MKNTFLKTLILALTLIFVLSLSVGLIACGSNSNVQNSSNVNSESETGSSSSNQQSSSSNEECKHQIAIDKAVDPTCTEDGVTAGAHCSTCGEVFIKQESIPAVGHSYSNNVCKTCGHTISVTSNEYFEFFLCEEDVVWSFGEGIVITIPKGTYAIALNVAQITMVL